MAHTCLGCHHSLLSLLQDCRKIGPTRTWLCALMISACAHGRCPRSRRLLLSTCTCLSRMARRQADGGCPDRRWKVISLFTGIGALELATHESQPWVLMCYAPTFPELPSQGCSASRLRQGPSACRCVKRLRGARRSNGTSTAKTSSERGWAMEAYLARQSTMMLWHLPRARLCSAMG